MSTDVNDGAAVTAPVLDWASDYDIFDPQYISDPFGIWDELRQTCPMAHTDRWGGKAAKTVRKAICSGVLWSPASSVDDLDDADPVAVAVKSHSEIEFLFRDKPLQIDQILGVGGIGVVIGKLAIHIHKQKMVLTG